MQGWNIQRPSRLHRQEIVACGHHARTVCLSCLRHTVRYLCAKLSAPLLFRGTHCDDKALASPTKASKVRKAVP